MVFSLLNYRDDARSHKHKSLFLFIVKKIAGIRHLFLVAYLCAWSDCVRCFRISAVHAEGINFKSKLKHVNIMLQSTSKEFCTFLGSFRKIAKSDYKLRHVCPFAWNNSCTTGRVFTKFDEFSKIYRENSCHCNLTSVTDMLHEDQHTFLIGSRSFLLRMRNSSGKKNSCIGNQNLFLPKIVPFMRLWGKIV